MCDFKLNLVAWMDGELPASDSAEAEQHLAICAECRQRACAYEDTSRDVAAYFAASVPSQHIASPPSRTYGWLPYVAAVAALLAIAFVCLPRSNRQPSAPVEVTATAISVPDTPRPSQPPAKAATPARHLATAGKRRPATQSSTPVRESAAKVPAIRIAIPADAVYPPGAMPDGFAYIASLAADGSIQQLAVQP